MAAIKSLNEISKKWAKNSAQSSDEYKAGVQNPRRDWAQATVASDEARKAGLAAADERDAFVKGVEEAGTSKWKERSVRLGPSRYSQGVRGAEDDHRKGFAPFHSVIAGLTLPPRGPKGSPENLERVAAVANALHAEKVGG